MTMKIKPIDNIIQSHCGDKIPIRYNNEAIGHATICDDCITMVVERNESEFKKAISMPGLSGFSFEIVGGNE